MEHTPEQLDLIRRMGEVSKRIDEVAAEHRTLKVEEARGLADALTALLNGVDRSAEMHRLCRQSGDLFREYLDTLR